MTKEIDKKRSIGDVAKLLGLESYVIRFWESKFPQIKPQIGKGGRRYYFDKEIAVLNKIKSLLYDEGYSISGLQKLLKKRKNSDLKEKNVEFLLSEDLVDTKTKDVSADGNEKSALNNQKKDFSLDDFINSNSIDQPNSIQVNNADSLKLETKLTINKLISKIEFDLTKL